MSRALAAMLLALCLLLFATARAGEPAVYGALPDVTAVEISPGGRYAAVLRNFGERKAVLFYDLDNLDQEPVGADIGASDAREIRWANDEHLLLLMSQSADVRATSGRIQMAFYRWFVMSRSTLKTRLLFGNEPGYYVGSPGHFIAVRSGDPEKAVFARLALRRGHAQNANSRTRISQDDPFDYNLFEVNLKNARKRTIGRGSPDTVNWIVDRNGDPLLRIDYSTETQKRTILLKSEGDARFKPLIEFDEPWDGLPVITLYGLSSDENSVLGTRHGDDAQETLVSFDPKTGEIGPALFGAPTRDIENVLYDPLTASVTGVTYMDDFERAYHLDDTDRKTQASIARALANASPVIVSKSRDGARLIVKADYPDHPTQFFLFDRQAKRLDMIATSYAALDNKVEAIKEPYRYTASDGLEIPGYLTAPKGAEKTAMPLIVLPHDGPERRVAQAFDWWSFFYASRGYLVYQPNFRGSAGYGLAFREAGFEEWGRRMQDDITEGVQKLIDDGVADPERICIIGAGYGGYAALAGAALTPDLYACAAGVSPITDLMSFLGEQENIVNRSAEDSEYLIDYWSMRIGDRLKDQDKLNAVSPAQLTKDIQAPILLIHGENDVAVPPAQSLQMRMALQRAGKAHEYVDLPGVDNALSSASTRTEMLRRSIDFIDEHIGEGSGR